MMAEHIQPMILTTTAANPALKVLIERLKFADPPSMVRIEPDSISGDPAPGAEARIADPAWLLGRQWQFGELTGENAGSVVAVEVASRALPITAWAPLGADSDSLDGLSWRPWRPGAVLEEMIQAVPTLDPGAGLRQRAEAGAQLVEHLHEAGATALADLLVQRYPLKLAPDPLSPEQPGPDEIPAPDETDEARAAREARIAERLAKVAARDRLDPQARRLLTVLAGTVPDGAAVLAALGSGAGLDGGGVGGGDGGGGDGGIGEGEPDWLTSAPAEAREALATWRDWAASGTEASGSGGAWHVERLEYRFALRFGDDDNAVFLRGTQFGSSTIRWSDLEWVPGARGALPAGAPAGTPVTTTATMLATPLRYPAMPSDRYWALEDGRVDLGAIEAQPTDLSRLCLAEYAMTSGDDWLGVPLDGLLGAINQVDRVTLTDNFGRSADLGRLDDPGLKLYQVSSREGRPLAGIVLPPVAADLLVGPAFEEVLFLRDETANMAWAIEQTVQGRSGDPRSRAQEPPPPPDPWPEGLAPDDRVYRLQTPIPAHWIPLVPVALRPGQLSLRKGALLRDGQPVLPEGRTLDPTPLTFPGEELAREGVHLRAVPVLARCADGRYARWASYRVRTGRGEAASRLAWDAALAAGDRASR